MFRKVNDAFSHRPTVDGFASTWNAQCKLFVSKSPEQDAWRSDFFSLSASDLAGQYLWLNPVWDDETMEKLIRWLAQNPCSAVVFVPQWSNKPWYQELHRSCRTYTMVYRQFGLFEDSTDRPMPPTNYDFVAFH